jgi:CHAT domain-containing protein
MAAQQMVEQLLALSSAEARRQYLEEHRSLLDDAFTEALKEEVFQLQRADIQAALQASDLILYTAKLTGNPLQRALGLRVEAQARAIELGEYQRALDLYDEAIQIYRTHHDELGEALLQVTRVWPLACLSRYTEAFEAGDWAGDVLKAHARWRALATLTMNLATIHGRLGEDAKALAMLDVARDAATQLGPEGETRVALVEQNRGIVLRNLGQFDAAIKASETAWEMNSRLGQKTAAARARQNLGVTYFLLGRYNEALELFDQARDFFVADGRERYAVLVDLFAGDCLLQLRRFNDVLDKSRRVRDLFSSLGTRFEVAQALLNEALAYAGLGRYAEALSSLAEVRRVFEAENNRVWLATADLEVAAVLSRHGQLEVSVDTAQACAIVFREHSLPIKEAQACLVAARSATELEQYDLARSLTATALTIGKEHDVPALLVWGHHLLSTLAAARHDLPQALEECDQAIQHVERLRGRLMVEFRAGFVEDKQVVYEDAITLCLALEEPWRGLEYVERAKSRALLDLLAFRFDLSPQVRSAGDQALVDELTQLRAERNRLQRRMTSGDEVFERGGESVENEPRDTQQSALALERRIAELWHTLLIHNADYAHDASLCQVRIEPVQPYLDSDTLLVEYFIARGDLIAFLVSAESVRAYRLAGDLASIQRWLQLLWHNLKTVPGSTLERIPDLARNAQGLLQRLYQCLIAPMDEMIASHPQLIIVPHGPLHYLPFHALHDGLHYLIQQHEISYLPSSSILHYCRQLPANGSGLLAVGHSLNGRLPYTVHEAQTVAALWNSQPCVEDQATLEHLRTASPACQVLHLAAHGDFRADNPLFSGLALADGWLTTFEVFNLHLQASLVSLSACQTGRSVVGGGDELLGLMRAFLYAGAKSLVLSQWAVNDRSTSEFMQTFYRILRSGQTKGAALRQAQLQLLGGTQSVTDSAYTHPYFWAPFFLVGDAGPLQSDWCLKP